MVGSYTYVVTQYIMYVYLLMFSYHVQLEENEEQRSCELHNTAHKVGTIHANTECMGIILNTCHACIANYRYGLCQLQLVTCTVLDRTMM